MNPGRGPIKKVSELLGVVKSVLLGRPNLSLENRRNRARLRMQVPVLCRVGHEDHPAELQDLSATGMRLLVPVALKLDQLVRISSISETGLVGRQRLLCRVVWVRVRRPEWEVGLVYADSVANIAESWVQLALRHLDPGHVNRRSRRVPADLPVHITDSYGKEVGRGVCVNLSTGGCLLETLRPLSPEDVIRIGLGPGEAEAAIYMSGRVLRQLPSVADRGFLHNVQFFAGENRNHSRLRSLLLTLLEEAHAEERHEQMPGVDPSELSVLLSSATAPPAARLAPKPVPDLPETAALAREQAEAVFRSNAPLTGGNPGAGEVPREKRGAESEVPIDPAQPLPLAAPVEYGVRPRLLPGGRPTDGSDLGERLGAPPLPLQNRSYTLRSTSLWSARNLPVGKRPRNAPQESRPLPPEAPRPDDPAGDFRA